MSKAAEFSAQGYNCAESVLKAYCEEHGVEQSTRVATAFGGGMGCGDTCGALVGALMGLGLERGRDSGAEENKLKEASGQLVEEFRQHFGCLKCAKLKEGRENCRAVIAEASGLLERFLSR